MIRQSSLNKIIMKSLWKFWHDDGIIVIDDYTVFLSYRKIIAEVM